MISKNRQKHGFTIVELLVVITIIGILATIVIIFYIGTHEKAIDTSLQSDLKNASTILELDRVELGTYPLVKEAANYGKGLKFSNNTTFTYLYDNDSYCLEATKETRTWYIKSDAKIPVRGTCAEGPADDIGGNSSTYVRAWSVNNSDDFVNDITNTVDGGYAIVGGTYNMDTSKTQAYITKFSADEQISWSRSWNINFNSNSALSVKQAPDGTYIVLSTLFDTDTKSQLTKLDANGNVIWNKIINSQNGDTIILKDVNLTSDNGFIATGDVMENSGSYSDDLLLMKFSNVGETQWAKSYDIDNRDEGSNVIQTNDGGYAVVGDTGINGMRTHNNILISKFNSAGEIIWGKEYFNSGNGYSGNIIQDTDGNLVISGSTDNGDGYTSLLAKYSIDGTPIWDKKWTEDVNYGNDTDSIIEVDNSYIISGVNSGRLILAGFDKNGNQKWHNLFSKISNSYLAKAIITKDSANKIVAASITDAFESEYNDAIIIKFEPNGIIPNCYEPTCTDPSFKYRTDESQSISNTSTASSNESILSEDYVLTINSPVSSTRTINIPPGVPVSIAKLENNELFVPWESNDQDSCSNTWSTPNGKNIRSLKITYETEQDGDYINIYSGDDEYITYMSGSATDETIDLSENPYSSVKICIWTNESTQNGFGARVSEIKYK